MSEHPVIVYSGEDSLRSLVGEVVESVGAAPLSISDPAGLRGALEKPALVAVVLDAAGSSQDVLKLISEKADSIGLYLLLGANDEALIKQFDLSIIDGFVPKMMAAPILKELLKRRMPGQGTQGSEGKPDASEAVNRRDVEGTAPEDGRLTGLMDKARFTDLLGDEKRREFFYENAYSIILVELDQMEKIREEYGHEGVVEVYLEIARLLQNNIRVTDTLVEWDLGRFMVLAEAKKDARRARRVAERLRRKVEGSNFRKVISVVTASFGVTAFDKEKSPEEHIKLLEKTLAEAAEKGKNKIVIA
jgi:diguanylate cyclase (GGDEF)-like protein